MIDNNELRVYRDRKIHPCDNQGGREPVYTENRTSNLRMGVFYDYWVEYCPRCGDNLVSNVRKEVPQ